MFNARRGRERAVARSVLRPSPQFPNDTPAASEAEAVPLPDSEPQDPRSFGLHRAAYSVSETLELLSIGRTKFYELVDQGDLRIAKLGTKSLVYVTDIMALLTKLRSGDGINQAPLDQGRGKQDV
jgi:excisionase family DNA binding protein